MARYPEAHVRGAGCKLRPKDYSYDQGKFIPVRFDKQILPGTFEYTLHYLIDNEIDLSVFDLRYQNYWILKYNNFI